jgi:hypothetical protein
MMPYDTALAERIRRRLGRQPKLTEKEMFGGWAHAAGQHGLRRQR